MKWGKGWTLSKPLSVFLYIIADGIIWLQKFFQNHSATFSKRWAKFILRHSKDPSIFLPWGMAPLSSGMFPFQETVFGLTYVQRLLINTLKRIRGLKEIKGQTFQLLLTDNHFPWRMGTSYTNRSLSIGGRSLYSRRGYLNFNDLVF